jgi:glycosyltransferase involved in cell wall biosynthesis
MKVSIIVPVYNEEKTILDVLSSINEQKIDNIDFEVVVIDDHSTDNTSKLLADHPKLYSKHVRLKSNCGKGGAVREGIRQSSGKYILFQDADLEYNPQDYTNLLKPVILFDADLVIGSRFLAPKFTRVAYFWHKVGNNLITTLFNIVNNLTFTDIYSCYVLFKREYINPDKLLTNGWEQQAEILSKVVKKASDVYEVPISYHGRTYAEGKKIRAHHIISVIYAIIRFKISK